MKKTKPRNIMIKLFKTTETLTSSQIKKDKLHRRQQKNKSKGITNLSETSKIQQSNIFKVMKGKKAFKM